MDTGALGRSQIPPKSDAAVAAQQTTTTSTPSVHENAGKTVPRTETDKRGPTLDQASSPAREELPKEPSRPAVDRRTVIDPKTEALLFQMVEERTGEVKRQIPDDVLLNVREYTRERLDTTAERKEIETSDA